MKTSVVLFKSKILANGDIPIMMRIFHAGKYKHISTGVSTKPKHWNSKQNRVGSTDKSYKEKNDTINSKYEMLCNRIKAYYSVFNDYDIEYIKSDKPIKKDEQEDGITDFYDLIQLKIEDYTKHSSQLNIIQVRNTLKKIFGDKLPITDITQKWFSEFVKNLKQSKSIPQAKGIINNFFKVYNWSVKQGFIPYRPLNYNKNDFTYHVQKRALSISEMSKLQFDWRTFHKNKKENYTFDFNNTLNALSIYLIMYCMQGIAPIDLILLRIKDFELKEYETKPFDYVGVKDYSDLVNRLGTNNEIKKYYSIKTRRKKTGKLLKIIVDYDILNPLIEDYLYKEDGTLKNSNDYLINVFQSDKTYTDKQTHDQKNVAFVALNKTLKKYLGVFRGMDISNFSYYSARHSYLTIGNYIGISHNILASLAGHTEGALQNYLKEFEDIKILEETTKIWNLGDNDKE
ncbi:hypothetical protein EZS27_013382 [termite gut metagenome]|uniref:Arm DNA-binding domain-containing protein n=1 Tax=termite gut metagenome TaxID=433724 RepID=A0A5J4RY00_9ZZZZ